MRRRRRAKGIGRCKKWAKRHGSRKRRCLKRVHRRR